jgi:hypothetical protein
MFLSIKNNKLKSYLFFIASITIWLLLVQIATSYAYYENVLLERFMSDPFSEGEQTFIDYILRIDFIYLIESADLFISFIYILIFSCFLLQLSLLFLNTKYNSKIIDFNLNVPPMLGIIGTLFALSIALGSPDFAKVFKETFSMASMTTIIGGITYILNLAIYIFIKENQNG